MKILQRYLLRDYLLTFGLTAVICTLVMCFGALKQVTDVLSRGAPAGAVLKILALQIPFVLQFTIPVSVMVATFLTVSHLSLDGELTAMRACGLSLAQIVAPVLAVSIALSLAAAYVANWAAPLSRHAQRREYVNLTGADPLALIEEGRFVRDFPGLLIRIGKKSGTRLHDIEIYDFTSPRVRTHIRARAGELEHAAEERRLTLRLNDVRVERTTAAGRGRPARTETWSAAEYPQDVDLREVLRRGSAHKKVSDITAPELIAAVRNVREAFPHIQERHLARERMRLLVELNNRLALSAGCFAFTALGVTLALRSKRRENWVGIGVSLAVMFFFYLFMILARELADRADLRADLLPWIPVAAFQIAGFAFLRRG